MILDEPLLIERSKPGLRAVTLPPLDVPAPPSGALPADYRRKSPPALPELSELDVTRHYTRLSQKNVSVDTHFYPLGSCTMKYNPKINEDFVRDAVIRRIHPYHPEDLIQPLLGMLYRTQEWLKAISGFPALSLQPSAGAHGELTCLMVIKAWHRDHGGENRTQVLIPDSAHGTNPATVVTCGYEPVELTSDSRGLVDLARLEAAVTDKTAAMMVTNPNTLGLFEERIVQIAKILHNKGAFLFMDGANFNAILGRARPHDFGVDAMHINLHKTFAVPHGGGGPGAGPVGVCARLAPYLPAPILLEESGRYRLDHCPPKSIGKVRGFFGSIGAILRSYCYLRTLGESGVRNVTDMAVLNANYLRKLVGEVFHIPFDRTCMHEFVAELTGLPNIPDRPAMNAAKRLLDLGFHPPTTYFPLIVHECWMVEPTESESKETLEAFAAAAKQIAREAVESPDLLKTAPHGMPVSRLDEVRAVREPKLTW